MTEVPTPSASRLPRARWRDTRLLLGVLLVLGSVVLGAKVVAEADDRVQVWAAARDLGPDTELSADDVDAVAVHLDRVAGRYVGAGENVEGLVLTRPVGRGELLPVDALAQRGSPERRRIVVEVPAASAAGLGKGSVVDLYVVREPAEDAGSADTGEPELVLAAVTVGEDVRGDGGLGAAASTAAVALLVEEADVPAVIDAVAHGTVYLAQVDE